MPRFRSVCGKWFSVREHYINDKAKPGEPNTYEGVDRAAQEILDKEGVEYLGQDCMQTEETIIKARQVGINTPEEYLLKFKNVDVNKMKEKQELALKEEVHLSDGSVFNKPKKISQPVNPPSGGQDTVNPKNSIRGGFGEPEMKK